MNEVPSLKLSVITHPVCKEHDTGSHPECIARLEAIEKALKADTALNERLNRSESESASDEAVLRCHTRVHLGRLEERRGESGFFDPDTAHSPKSIEAARRAAGAAIRAVDHVLNGKARSAFALVRPPGHHACPERAMGFCMINNVAVAARYARSRGVDRVLIVDFDVHHGNGTQEIFYEDPDVFFYSLHAHPHYPGTGMANETGQGRGEGTTLNRPLPLRTPAAEYRKTYTADIEKIVRDFRPDLVLFSAGFDSHRLDPLGGLMLEAKDYWELTKIVVDKMPEGRIASTLEGGYNLDVLGESVCQHLRALAGLERRSE